MNLHTMTGRVHSPFAFALGRAVRRRRAALGVSQEAFAERVGLHRTYVGSVERGERNISLENILRLAVALSLRPSDLLRAAEAEAAGAAEVAVETSAVEEAPTSSDVQADPQDAT